MNDHSVLFLGKKNDSHCEKALQFVRQNFPNCEFYLGEWGDPFPGDAWYWEGSHIISYLSRWIVPAHLLARARIAAINFHPASPDYPGIGCNNFALYEGAEEFGVVCHHMAPQVDTGGIIAVKRFPVFQSDNVDTLLKRTYDFQLALFYEIVSQILNGEELPESPEKWSRKPFSRREFNELGTIKPDMDASEVQRRIRATSYGVYQPVIKIGDFVFEYKGG